MRGLERSDCKLLGAAVKQEEVKLVGADKLGWEVEDLLLMERQEKATLIVRDSIKCLTKRSPEEVVGMSLLTIIDEEFERNPRRRFNGSELLKNYDTM